MGDYKKLYMRLKSDLEEQCYMGCFGICKTCKIEESLKQAAEAVEKLTAENKRLRRKIRDMKSSASWDEDIRRGQVTRYVVRRKHEHPRLCWVQNDAERNTR